MLERRRLGLLLHLGASVSSSKLILFFVHLQAMQLVEELIPAHLHSFSMQTQNRLDLTFVGTVVAGVRDPDLAIVVVVLFLIVVVTTKKRERGREHIRRGQRMEKGKIRGEVMR
ncbi:unnamed protein product [Linum trigynum]|uniref:Uncharacterized protein n=1 Tax=Linum trigynum TaxID=586398 RepID=A0AAV2CG14_9ROSI